MFEKTISKDTKSCLVTLEKSFIVKDFYLAGGTGLALQIGHRISLDLDFFCQPEFHEQRIISYLQKNGDFKLQKKDWQTINGILNKTRVSFMNYPYPLLYPARKLGKIKIADIRDIACMKLDAIATRGSKKDFIDLYLIIKEHYSLSELISLFNKKYQKIKYNLPHLFKSLVYFADAEKDPMPKMFYELKWLEVKNFLQKEVIKLHKIY